RPLSHGDGHGSHFRDFRRDLPLVPEGHRANAERDARQVSLLGHVPRGLFDLLPHALSGPAGCAATLFRARRNRFHSTIGHDPEYLHHDGSIDRGLRPDGVPVQPDLELVQRQAGWQQPLEGHNAGVANTRNPARARQLGEGVTGGLSLGLRLQRAGRRAGFRAAKPARDRTRRLGKRAVSFTILFFLAPIGVIVAWWLSRQRLMAKPWLDVSAIGEVPDTGASSSPAATIGL